MGEFGGGGGGGGGEVELFGGEASPAPPSLDETLYNVVDSKKNKKQEGGDGNMQLLKRPMRACTVGVCIPKLTTPMGVALMNMIKAVKLAFLSRKSGQTPPLI